MFSDIYCMYIHFVYFIIDGSFKSRTVYSSLGAAWVFIG